MPFIAEPASPLGLQYVERSAGAARPGALESVILVNGLALNDHLSQEEYFVKSVDGLWGTDIRDQREPKVNDDGEDVYDTLLGGKTITINGHLDAWTLDRMRDMEQALEQAFPHNYDYPVVFDRSQLRAEGISKGVLDDRNWTVNPSVEQDLKNWSTFGTNTIDRVTLGFDGSLYGRFSAEVAVNNNTQLLRVDTDVDVAVGDYYQVAIDIFIPSDWSGGQITISDGNFNGGTRTFVASLSNADADMSIVNRWQRIWATYHRDAGTSTSSDLLVASLTLPNPGTKLRFDGVTVRVGASTQTGTPTFVDGDSQGWKWNGVPHKSDSQIDADAYRQDVFFMARRIDKIGLRDEQASQWFKREFQIPLRLGDPCIYSTTTKIVTPGTATNLVPNPSFETNTTGWVAMGGATLALNTTTNPVFWEISGLTTMRVTGSAAGVIGTSLPTGTGGISIPGGGVYSASLQLNYVTRSNGASGGVLSVDIYFYDSSGTIITGSAPTNTVEVGVQQLKVENVQAPGNAAFMTIRVYTADNVNAAVDFSIDSVMVNEGPVALTYFDGSTQAAYWTGTAHASRSIGYTELYIKNHGNYLARPRLRITGPWTNFAMINTTLLDGEITERMFSFSGSIADGDYFEWDENTQSLVDSNGASQDGLVDAQSNKLAFAGGRVNTCVIKGTGLNANSEMYVAYEDTWK